MGCVKAYLPMEKKPLTEQRLKIIILEEAVSQLPRLQHESQLPDGLWRDSDAMNEYEACMRAKSELAELTGRQWAEYIHQAASFDYHSKKI